MDGTIPFDSLAYFEKLKNAGVPEPQAKAQTEALQDFIQAYDAASRKDLATKGDINDLRLNIQEVKHDILKWIFTGMLAQGALIVALVSYIK